jgi:hypothetical protein
MLAGLLCALAAPMRGAEAAAAAPRGFLLGEGPPGAADDFRNGGAIVRWNQAAGLWYLWYYGRDQNWPKDIAPSLGTGRILLATSDDGLNWRRYAGPGFGGAILEPDGRADRFDSLHICTSDMLFHEGAWWLWYFGGDEALVENGPRGYEGKGNRMRPGLARSRDGVTFTRVPGNSPSGALLEIGENNIYRAFPSAIHDGKRFILYTSTLSSHVVYWDTEVALSTDGVSFEPLGRWEWEGETAGPETGGSNTRHILRNERKKGDPWLMLYTALDARFPLYTRSIMAATSRDGLRWKRLFDEPVLTIGPRDAWDGGGVSFPQAVRRPNGDLWIYYYGFADRANTHGVQRGLGLAIAEGGDLRKLRRIQR